MENITILERTVANENVVKSLVKLEKATVTITSRFDGSERLYDLLLTAAKAGLEQNMRISKLAYTAEGGS